MPIMAEIMPCYHILLRFHFTHSCLRLLLNKSDHYKSFSVAFLLEDIQYTSPIHKFKEKRLVNMRKETHIIEIKQNFCQKSVITIKIEKEEFYPCKIFKRIIEHGAWRLNATFNS